MEPRLSQHKQCQPAKPNNITSHTIKNSKKKAKNKNKQVKSSKNKRTKRSKKNQKEYRNITIYHSNIRGIKSKTATLKSIIEEKKPTIVCITETHLSERDEFKLKGYRIYRNNRNEDGGGIIVAVKQFLEHETSEVAKVQDIEETLWLKIENKKLNLRLGVIYGPQESEKKEDIESTYDRMQEQINAAKINNENIVIVGDFNAKINIKTNEHEQKESKAGKILEQFVKRNNLLIVNRSKKSKGLWTRVDPSTQGKSVLDYTLIDKHNEERINSFEADEGRNWTPHYVKDLREVYSDHNAINTDLKFDFKVEVESQKRTTLKITDETKKTYQLLTSNSNLTEISNRNQPLNKKYKRGKKR